MLTIYLPVDLDDATVASFERLKGPPYWREEDHWEPEEDRSKYPMEGFLSQKHGWMEGKVEYRGQAARRLVYFFKFEDEEGERYYKEDMKWGRRIRNGRATWDVMEHFLEDLEKLGMIGFESLHVRFLEIVDNIPENASFPTPPSLPIVITRTAEEVARLKMLDDLYETCNL